MVTPAEFAVFQQQLRQEVAVVIQQLRAEVNESISGRMDMLNSISTSLQNVSAKPTDSKPFRISDLLPRNWKCSNEKGKFRSFMSDLHLWMQAWSNQGEKCMSVLRAPTGSTAARLHLTVQMKNSDPLRRVTIPSIAQNDSKRTADNNATDKKDRKVPKHGMQS